MFLGHGLDIWILSIIIGLFRLKQSKQRLKTFGALVTVGISIFAAVLLTVPLMNILSLSASYKYFILILIALSAENIMESIVNISSDTGLFKEVLMTIFRLKTNGDKKDE